MGMDISGIDPIVRGVKPEIDWDTATESEKKEYFKQMEVWEGDNPGYYFRANLWSWRPIHALIDIANRNFDLGIDTSNFGYNDGSGVRDQSTCDRLADALEHLIEDHTHLDEMSDRLYLVLGSWCTIDGQFLDHKYREEADAATTLGDIIYTPLVLSDGTLVVPSHGVSRKHLEIFIAFLRECGGFEIW